MWVAGQANVGRHVSEALPVRQELSINSMSIIFIQAFSHVLTFIYTANLTFPILITFMVTYITSLPIITPHELAVEAEHHQHLSLQQA